MHIATIGVEDWLNVWEKSATYDIAQSTISSMTMGEILALDDEQGATFYERLNKEKMNYGWIEGSPAFKEEVAKLYRSSSIGISSSMNDVDTAFGGTQDTRGSLSTHS